MKIVNMWYVPLFTLLLVSAQFSMPHFSVQCIILTSLVA